MKWCWHDWEVLARDHDASIEHRVREHPGRVVYEGGGSWYVKKICLKCGKIVDTITEYEEVIRKNIDTEITRKAVAIQLMLEKEIQEQREAEGKE